MKVPSLKLQAPDKSQTPGSNAFITVARLLSFGFWSFSGTWSLGFGAS
jgi:hypothetical protein